VNRPGLPLLKGTKRDALLNGSSITQDENDWGDEGSGESRKRTLKRGGAQNLDAFIASNLFVSTYASLHFFVLRRELWFQRAVITIIQIFFIYFNSCNY
jgi:hypothetical protein